MDNRTASFVHLHCHSHYSFMRSTSTIQELVDFAGKNRMPAIAVCDHGNMGGAFSLLKTISKFNESHKESVSGPLDYQLKGIIGLEVNICEDHLIRRQFDPGFPQVLLAMNETGYQNLCKLSSIAYIEGFYQLPRISKRILSNYSDGIIATSGSLDSEIPSLISQNQHDNAEHALVWMKGIFGDRFYIELNRTGRESEDFVNEVLLKFAMKYAVKFFAASNNYFIKKSDFKAYCILRKMEMGDYSPSTERSGQVLDSNLYIRSQKEMEYLFRDLPEALKETIEISKRVDEYELEREVSVPVADVPENFENSDEYLRYLTSLGIIKRYGVLSKEISSRFEFELRTIKSSGQANYLLFWHELMLKAQEFGYLVGPGECSSAGSLVLFCLGFTNIDPLKFGLLFHRFMNVDRIAQPYINMGLSLNGCTEMVNYLLSKCGREFICQTASYERIGGRRAIKEASMALNKVNIVDDEISAIFDKLPKVPITNVMYDDNALRVGDDITKGVMKFREHFGNQRQDIIDLAIQLDNCLIGLRSKANLVIIGSENLNKRLPLATIPDSELFVSQFNPYETESTGNQIVEFVSLISLSIISDTIHNISRNKGVHLILENMPHDDPATLQLFGKGNTIGISGFDSDVVRNCLFILEPENLEELIVVYGISESSRSELLIEYASRKRALQKIEYDIPDISIVLGETGGLLIFQEQVMRILEKTAGLTKGESDTFRKVLGRTNLKKETKEKFTVRIIEGLVENGYSVDVANALLGVFENDFKFLQSKAYTAAMTMMAYQMAYLKAHYPYEFMVSLVNNAPNIETRSTYLAESERLGIELNIE